MPKYNLMKMSVESLIALRNDVQKAISKMVADRRSVLQKQIDALAQFGDMGPASTGKVGRGRGRAKQATTKKAGVKRGPVAPKYRGPGGETWSGRGLPPRWLSALEAQGKKRESFLIKKPARAG